MGIATALIYDNYSAQVYLFVDSQSRPPWSNFHVQNFSTAVSFEDQGRNSKHNYFKHRTATREITFQFSRQCKVVLTITLNFATN